VDNRHRVYYLVNLNQNHKKEGWWSKGWDDYGWLYKNNLKMLKQHVKSLKIRPTKDEDIVVEWYSMRISCKKEEQAILVELLDKLPDVNYIQLWRL
jgi:hypothetical protein